ncbi:hypothetical protein [Neobacillus cucumis]|uniref:hypothetical protein n=1 Tax=Neobacillus cucumis TaxID=1740721 RepID=UPI002E251E43|nr:hypothetical protein [Neobacillus cucumis]
MKRLSGLMVSLVLTTIGLVACTQTLKDKTEQNIDNPPLQTQLNTTNVSDQTKTDKGKHIGTEFGGQRAGYGQVKKIEGQAVPPIAVAPPVSSVSTAEINAILDDINKTLPSPNARYEDGWIKFEIIMDYVPNGYYMNKVYQILDNHGVRQVDYMAENVVWDCPPEVSCTGHHGTACIKVDKK